MADKKISQLPAATTPLAGTEVLPIVQSGVTDKVSVANLTAGRAISATQYTSTIATGTAPFVVSSTTEVANLHAATATTATSATTASGLSATLAIASGGTNQTAFTSPASSIAGLVWFDGTSFQNDSTTSHVGYNASTNVFYANTPTFSGDTTLSTGNLVVGTSGKGIDFSATPGTGTSELFADYEEGTFTATWANLSGTPSNTTGYYTKIGRQVFFTYAAGPTSLIGVANSTTFTLPFTPTVNAVGSIMSTAINNGGLSVLYTDGKCYPASFSSANMVFSGVFSV